MTVRYQEGINGGASVRGVVHIQSRDGKEGTTPTDIRLIWWLTVPRESMFK
jgi:hypothetical protein